MLYDLAGLTCTQLRFPSPIRIGQGSTDEFLAEQLHPERFVEAAQRSGTVVELHRHEEYGHGYWFVQSFVAEHLQHHCALLR